MSTVKLNPFRNSTILVLLSLVIFPVCGEKEKEKNLVLGSGGETNYQIIVPDKTDEAIERAGILIREAFGANGIDIPLVRESQRFVERSGIYLGATNYALEADIEESRFEGWEYLLRVAGEDLIIAGSSAGKRQGVVKGVCDFLREFAGVRFLYPGETGTEFLEMEEISVPARLDRAVTPMVEFNYSGDMYPEEWLYNIANNHFPASFTLGGRVHSWGEAIPYEEYYHSHPEYFALLDGERHSGEKSQYCISNPAVKELILQYMTNIAEEGYDMVYLGQPDAFRPCECEDCYELYGTGDDWDEKVWLFDREICEDFMTRSPGTKVLMLGYQATTHPPKTFDRLPDNVVIELHHGHDEALEEWSGTEVEVPGGIILVPRLFGSHYLVTYLPKRTPGWLEDRVRQFHETGMNIMGFRPFGAIDCYGLAGPAYYVFGRMFDDPENNKGEDLVEEFYTAAFGEAADPMRNFYGYLHDNLSFMAEWFFPRSESRFFMGLDRKPTGIDDQLDWVRVSTAQFGARAMHRGMPDPGQALSLIYTADLALNMERELEQAESLARSEKVKKRLELVRMEFTYLTNVTRVNNLYNAWKAHCDEEHLNRLLYGVDAWNNLLDSYYDENGKMISVQGWPEVIPFRGTGRRALGLVTARWWKNKDIRENPFAWDTEEIRGSGQFMDE